MIVKVLNNLPQSFEALGARYDNAALLRRAGVQVAITSGETWKAYTLRQEAGNAVAYGLPWERVESCDWIHYGCRVHVQDGVLCCERDLEMRGGSVPPHRYDEVRQFTEACIEDDASDIVLIRGELSGGGSSPAPGRGSC